MLWWRNWMRSYSDLILALTKPNTWRIRLIEHNGGVSVKIWMTRWRCCLKVLNVLGLEVLRASSFSIPRIQYYSQGSRLVLIRFFQRFLQGRGRRLERSTLTIESWNCLLPWGIRKARTWTRRWPTWSSSWSIFCSFMEKAMRMTRLTLIQ